MGALSVSRKLSSTACLSHWLTRQPPCPSGSATRAWPGSSASSAASTCARSSPPVEGERVSRRSHRASMRGRSVLVSMGGVPGVGRRPASAGGGPCRWRAAGVNAIGRAHPASHTVLRLPGSGDEDEGSPGPCRRRDQGGARPIRSSSGRWQARARSCGAGARSCVNWRSDRPGAGSAPPTFVEAIEPPPRLPHSGPDQRPRAPVGEQLPQHGVRHAPVQDHRALHPAARRRRRRSRPSGSCRRRSSRLRCRPAPRPPSAPGPACRRGRARRPRRSSSEPLGPERAGDGAGHRVGVDVVGLPVRADADRRDHRHDVGADQQVRARGCRRSPARRQSRGRAPARCGCPGRAPCASACARGSGRHPCRRCRRRCAPARVMASATCLLTGPARTISTTSSIAASVTRRPCDEGGFDVQPLEHGVDLRPAAMHHDRIDAHLLQQRDVAAEAQRGLLLAHRVAAVLHHDDLVVVALQERQRAGEGRHLLERVIGHRIGHAPRLDAR